MLWNQAGIFVLRLELLDAAATPHTIMRTHHLNIALLAVALAACSNGEPFDEVDPDPLSLKLRQATEQVPSFGGVAVNGDTITIYTLGSEPAAEPIVRSIFPGEMNVMVQERPSRGAASSVTLRSVRRLAPTGTLYSLGIDNSVGYLRVGVPNLEAARAISEALATGDVSLGEIILEVVRPPELRRP